MARRTKVQILAEKDLELQTKLAMNCVQVSIWDLSKISAVGKKAQSEGKSGEALREVISEFIQTIRHN